MNLGWLVKEGTGGFSKSTRYTLCVPDVVAPKTVAEQATVAESATVAQQATQTVAESATPPLAESATRKEQSIEHTNEQKNTARARSTAIAKPDGVTDQTWSDFLQQRKRQRAEVTQTALNGIAREAALAGYTLEQALVTCCTNGWRGFKAEWMQQRGQNHRPPTETAYQQQMRERAAVLTPRLAARAPQQPAGDFFREQAIEVQAQEVGGARMIGGQ